MVAGALGRYLDAAGTNLDRAVALVPVSVRPDGPSEGETGNRISTVFVDLPVSEAGLDARIAAIAGQTRELKASAAVRAGALMVGASGLAPPLVSGLLARTMGSVRAFNLVVSNLPGPQQPFYLDGVQLRGRLPGGAAEPGQPGSDRRNDSLATTVGSASACSPTATWTLRWPSPRPRCGPRSMPSPSWAEPRRPAG